MKLYDRYFEKEYTINDIKRSYLTALKEGDEWYTENLLWFACSVLQSSMRGENDIDIIDLTPQEVTGIVNRIHNAMKKKEGVQNVSAHI